jgi:GT2 family glycosyltransferase
MRDICIIIPTLDKEKAENVGKLAQLSAGLDTRLEIVYETEARGFTKAVNRGLKRTLPTEDVCLLNDDVYRFPYSWLAVLREALYTEQHYGIAVPSGDCASSMKNGIIGGSGLQVVNTVPFWSALIKRDVIEKLGFLDEEFIHYSSDTWYCIEARRAGWRSLWVKSVYLWHEHEGSGFRTEWRANDSNVFKRKMLEVYTKDVFR